MAPNEVCGLGVKMRDVRCKRSDARIVTSDSCVGVAGPLPVTHVGCNVTCDDEVSTTTREYVRMLVCDHQIATCEVSILLLPANN